MLQHNNFISLNDWRPILNLRYKCHSLTRFLMKTKTTFNLKLFDHNHLAADAEVPFEIDFLGGLSFICCSNKLRISAKALQMLSAKR